MLHEYQTLEPKYSSVRECMQCYLANTASYNSARIRQASIDRDLRNGKTGVYGTIFSDLKDHETEVFNLNPFKAKCDSIYGNQLNNIKSIIAIPTDDGIQETADDWTTILLKVQQEDKTQSKVSEVFNYALTSGMELLFTGLEFDSDLSLKIATKHIPFNEFYIDNSFKELDLSDCKYILKWGHVTKEEARYLLPDYKSQIDEIISCKERREKPSEQIGKHKLEEFWYLDYRVATVVTDMDTKRKFEWEGTEEELDYFLRLTPSAKQLKHTIPTVRLAISLDKTVFFDEWNPFRIDRYPFALFTCNFDKTITSENRTYGFVRNLRGPGYLGARAQTLYWKNLEKMVFERLIYKPTSLINPEEAQEPGLPKGIALRQEAAPGDVSVLPGSDISSQVASFTAAMQEEMRITSGVNEAMMGSSDDDSGIKMVLRQGAGLNIQAPIFHNLDIAVQNLGEIFYDLIRTNYSYEKVAQLLGKEPTSEFYTQIFGKYRIEIVQGTNTTTQKVLQAKQLMDLSQAGVPIDPMDIFDAYPLQGKAEIRKKAEARLQQEAQTAQQQAEIEQMQLQQAMQLKQAEIDTLETNAQHNIAKTKERETKAISNVVSAQKDRSQEILNVAKALDEVKSNFERLSKLVDIIVNQGVINEIQNSSAGEIAPSELL